MMNDNGKRGVIHFLRWHSLRIVPIGAIAVALVSAPSVLAYPASAAPLVSSEIDVNPNGSTLDPLPGGVGGGHPAIASDGTNALVVWIDDREGGSGIFGARLDAHGTLLDAVGFPISLLQRDELPFPPAVTFNGTNYVVAWNTLGPGPVYSSGLFAARVSPGGVVLDSPPMYLGGGDQTANAPAMATDGTNVFVSGILIDGSGNSTATVSGVPGSAAWNGSEYLVTSVGNAPGCTPPLGTPNNCSAVLAQYFSAGGVAVGTPFLVAMGAPIGYSRSTEQERDVPVVASNGKEFAIAWSDGTNVFMARVSGTAVTGPTTVAGPTAASAAAAGPYIAFDGTNYVVTWAEHDAPLSNHSHSHAARVDASGKLLDPGGVPLSLQGNRPLQQINQVSTSIAGNSLVVWQEQSAPSGFFLSDVGVRGARFTATGGAPDVASGFQVSQGGNEQDSPAVAFDGTNFLVVWLDHRNATGEGFGQPQVRATRITPAGVVLDPDSIVLASDADSHGTPAVAFDGNDYLVTWVQGIGGISGKRVSPGGVVLDATALVLAPPTLPACGWDGGNSLSFGAGYYLSMYCQEEQFQAVLLQPSGTVIKRLSIPTRSTGSSAIGDATAFDGANFWVTWSESPNPWAGMGTDPINLGSRLSPAGVLLDQPPLTLPGAQRFKPSIACDPARECLVQGFRLSPQGTFLDDGGANSPSAPVGIVAWDGTQFVSVYPSPGPPLYLFDYPQVSASRIAVDGAASSSFLVSPDNSHHQSLAVASDGKGSVLAAYGKFVAEKPYDVRRLRARLIGSGSQQDAGMADAGAEAAPGVDASASAAADATTESDSAALYDAGSVLGDDAADAGPDGSGPSTTSPDSAPTASPLLGDSAPEAGTDAALPVGEGGGAGCGCYAANGHPHGAALIPIGVALFALRRRRTRASGSKTDECAQSKDGRSHAADGRAQA